MLDELRGLVRSHPSNTAVSELLAIGLFNKLEGEYDLTRRDALFGELRVVANAHLDDAVVRQPLAWALIVTSVNAEVEGDFPRRDAALDELRALAKAYPEDPALREIAQKL